MKIQQIKQIIKEEIQKVLNGNDKTPFPYDIIKSSDKAVYIKFPVYSKLTGKQEYKETWMPKSIIDKNLVDWFLNKALKDINDKRISFANSKGNYRIEPLLIGTPPVKEYKANIKLFLNPSHPFHKKFEWNVFEESEWYVMDASGDGIKLTKISSTKANFQGKTINKIQDAISRGYNTLILTDYSYNPIVVLTNIPSEDIYGTILKKGSWFGYNFPSQTKHGQSLGASKERDLNIIKHTIKLSPSSDIKFIDQNKKP